MALLPPAPLSPELLVAAGPQLPGLRPHTGRAELGPDGLLQLPTTTRAPAVVCHAPPGLGSHLFW